MLFAVLALTALMLALQLNRSTLLLAVFGGFLAVSYPFVKRFLSVPQMYLGLTFGWGIPMAFMAQIEQVPRVGWLEWVINTPSAHRVHHASNAEYIDKNYGGVLLIWDRLFGSYQAERPDIEIRYGLAHPRSAPNNPFVIAYEDLWLTLKEAFSAGSVGKALARMWGPP